jgi:type IV pilus assembly protein PilC
VIVVVIPKFREIFQSFDVGLPPLTQVLLDVSQAATQYWYVVFGVPIGLLVLHLVLMRRGGAYRYRAHALLLRTPVLGDVLQQGLIAGFARTFGTLIEAGVPHLDALAIVRDTSPNDVLARSVEDVRRTVREGEAIAAPMAESPVFDDLVVNMVDVGEETGELDRMLLRVATAYEGQVDRKIDTLFKVLEPALLIAMAVVVGFIVVALFMPLMSIMNQLQSAA